MKIRICIGVILTLLVSACSLPNLKLPRVHKISVQQGNVITQEMIDKIKPGMSRSQVAYVMGEPILRNTFDGERWDYIYTISIPGYFEQSILMSLFFADDALTYFTGDLAPSSAQPDEEVDSTAEVSESDLSDEAADEAQDAASEAPESESSTG